MNDFRDAEAIAEAGARCALPRLPTRLPLELEACLIDRKSVVQPPFARQDNPAIGTRAVSTLAKEKAKKKRGRPKCAPFTSEFKIGIRVS